MNENLNTKYEQHTVPDPSQREKALTKSENEKNIKADIEKIPTADTIKELIQNEVDGLRGKIPDSRLREFAFIQGKKALEFLKDKRNSAFRFIKTAGIGYLSMYALAHTTNEKQRPFSDRKKAQQEMNDYGITAEQQSGHVKYVSDFLYRSIDPDHYPELDQLPYFVKSALEHNISPRDMSMKISEDGWALYLGIPQKNNTFGISDFQPNQAKNDAFYYNFNDREAAMKLIREVANRDDLEPKDRKLIEEYRANVTTDGRMVNNQRFLAMVNEIASHPNSPKIVSGGGDIGFMLENFKMSAGKDEHGNYVSIYDIYDFGIPTEGTFGDGVGMVGKPFEIYDRFYYDEKTGEFIK